MSFNRDQLSTCLISTPTLFWIKGLQQWPKTGNPKNIVKIELAYQDPGSYIPSIFLLDFWGSLFGVPTIEGALWHPFCWELRLRDPGGPSPHISWHKVSTSVLGIVFGT